MFQCHLVPPFHESSGFHVTCDTSSVMYGIHVGVLKKPFKHPGNASNDE